MIDKYVTIQYGQVRKSYDPFGLAPHVYEFLQNEWFGLPKRYQWGLHGMLDLSAVLTLINFLCVFCIVRANNAVHFLNKRKSINDIPDEILNNIFKHLTIKSLQTVVQVSHRFFRHAAPLIWSYVSYHSLNTNNSPESLIALAKTLSKPISKFSYESFIKTLLIYAYDPLPSAQFRLVLPFISSIPNMSNLTSVNMSLVGLVGKNSQNIQWFRQSNIHLSFIEILKLPRLESLTFDLLPLEEVCRVLKRDYGFGLRNATIRSLSLGLIRFPASDGHLKAFIQMFCALKHLKISWVTELALSFWADILSSETIRSLHIVGAKLVIPNAGIIPSLPASNVKSLWLQTVSCRNDTLGVFLSPLSHLTELSLIACRISNNGASPLYGVMPQLTEFSYSTFNDRCEPYILRSFLHHECRLRELNLSGSIDDEGLREISGIRTLEVVYFSGINSTTNAIGEFMQSNTALRKVEFYDVQLDPTYIIPLIGHGPHIHLLIKEPTDNLKASLQTIVDKLFEIERDHQLPTFQFLSFADAHKRDVQHVMHMFPRFASHVEFGLDY